MLFCLFYGSGVKVNLVLFFLLLYLHYSCFFTKLRIWNTYRTKKIEQKYIYCYLTLKILINFLETGELFLTRLDKFEDNLENISPYDINELKVRSCLIKKPKDVNPAIPEHQWEHLIDGNKASLTSLQDKRHVQQKQRFVSCWILGDVESFATCDIFGKAGFAVRFDRKYFQNLIRESMQHQEGLTSKIDHLVAGKVTYQDFDNMILKEQESKLKYSVFRKHLSFNHESEYRIEGFVNDVLEIPGLSKSSNKFELLGSKFEKC